jgi:thiol-disulfide isomerase/thioredoxin
MRSRSLKLAMVLAFSVGGFGLPGRAQAPAPDPAKASATELDQGQLLIEHGQFFEGLKRLRRANELAGNRCAECLVSMAEAMQGMKAYQNVLDTAQSALALTDNEADLAARAHIVRGQAFEGLAAKDAARFADAEAEYRAAFDAGKTRHMAEAQFDLGFVLLRQSRDDEGRAALQRTIELEPGSFLADDAKALVENPRRAREKYAPEFSLETADRRTITLESLRGKVVLLDFWASWCQPCVKALPAIRKLQAAHASDPFVMIAVSADEDESVWRRFTAKNGMDWTQYWDGSRAMQANFKVNAFPTYVLLDAEGIERLRATGSGFNQSRELQQAIEAQIAQARR